MTRRTGPGFLGRSLGSSEMEEEDDMVCLDESFFIDDNYQLTSFKFGSHELQLLCLQSASTDYDLTGQLIWPGAMLLNNYLSKNSYLIDGRLIIELGSGVGITGIFCSKFCSEVVLTDHNDEVLKLLKANIELHTSSKSLPSSKLFAEKLEWGNEEHIGHIKRTYPEGFDLVLGADICFQQSSIRPLFDTVEKLLTFEGRQCKFMLAYVSRSKMMDSLVKNEAIMRGMMVTEIPGTRTEISNLEGLILEITISSNQPCIVH